MELADVHDFHDWYLIGYRFACERRNLVLEMAWYPDTANARRLDVEFQGVVGHAIENAQAGNIVLSLDEVTPRQLVAGEPMFERLRNYGFPDPSLVFKGTEELIALLEVRSMRAFEFSSSLGAWGFVLAERMSILPVES